jgi:hypothetical protein
MEKELRLPHDAVWCEQSRNQLHRLVSILLALALTGSPAVHAFVAQAHAVPHHAPLDAQAHAVPHHGPLDAQDVVAEHACDEAEEDCPGAVSHATCCPALSGQCSGPAAVTASRPLDPLSARSLETSSVAPDTMSSRDIEPETPPPRS